MDINYELYKVFYHVAVTLSFSEASKQLFISQSAVSQSIKVLEKEAETAAFHPQYQKVQLTPEGEILLKHIEPAMNLIQKGENQLLEAHTLNGGQLRIGASDTICRYYLVPYLKQFHKEYPNIHIKVINHTSIECAKALENGQTDFIIANYPNSALAGNLHTRVINEFHDVFVANPAYYPLKSRVLRLAELSGYPLITLERHCTTCEFLHNLFLQHQLELVPEIELSSNDLLIDFARIGLGIACVPDYCVREGNEDLDIIETKETMPARQIVASVNPTLPINAPTEAFLDLLPSL